MRHLRFKVAASVAAFGALALPATAFGIAQINEQPDAVREFDVRSGAIAPSSAQRAAVRRLGAKATWNRFGTPATLSKRGKYLAKNVRGKNAAIAARNWLERNKALFRLRTTAGLVLERDTRLAFSRGHAVHFRQVFEGMRAVDGGLISIGLTGPSKGRWKVAFVSSALTADQALAGRAKMSAVEGWAAAASATGARYHSVTQVRGAKNVGDGWLRLNVAGGVQQVRAVAFPTVRAGVVPAFESYLHKDRESSFRVVTDARNGAVLTRQSTVHNAEAARESALVEQNPFSGEVPAVEAACGPLHPFTVGSGVRYLDGFVAATQPLNDIVFNLFRDGTLLISADTNFSPEAFHYEPAGGVPPGNYSVQVCDFDDANNVVWTEPRTYTGRVIEDDTPAPAPYLARWKSFPSSPLLGPGGGDPWGRPSTNTREVVCWYGAPGCDEMGYDVTGPTGVSTQQVHANGEIWSATNFRIRSLLADKYDDDFPYDDADLQRPCATGELAPYACPGNRRWMQLVFDAMLLMPVNPTMLQARDAALAADLMRFGGANQKELWLGYARSGMGRNAFATNSGLAETDTDPVPDFESPLHDNATIKFVAKAKDGGTVPARIFVGHYEARVSPIADTNPATPAAGTPAAVVNLDDTAKFAPATYEFVATAPGYGHLRFRKTLYKGEESTIELRFAANHASANRGAAASGDTSGATTAAQAAQLRNLIDDAESTNWTTAGTVTSGNLSVDGKKVTVDLAGTEPVNVKHVNVSALVSSGQSRFTALRQFELWACNGGGSALHDDGPAADCSQDSGYHRVYTAPANAFPGDAPRPVAPIMLLREFDIPNTKATHLRLVVKTNQCTGGPQFQGDQDADAVNNPDCDLNPTAAVQFVRAAELQAFSGEGSVYRFDD